MNDSRDDQNFARASALARDIRGLLKGLRRRLREQANADDLTPSQSSVLLRLEKDGPATMSDLARAEGMRPQSMGPLVAALEVAGLIDGTPHPTDGRRTLLELTAACRQKLREGRAARQDWLARALAARLSPGEQERAAEAVELLRRLVDD